MTSQSSVSHPYRASVIFVAGLVLTAGGAFWMDGSIFSIQSKVKSGPPQVAAYRLRQPEPLSVGDMAAARTAWSFFALNVDPTTGLSATVADYGSTTIWDQGSYLLALLAARRLELIDEPELEDRIDRLLKSLGTIRLLSTGLPNKAYDIHSLKMTTYDGSETEAPIGTSALDVGRLLAGLLVLERRHPEFASKVIPYLSHWKFCGITKDGDIYGYHAQGQILEHMQEGSIGYEQYAARAATLWGCDAHNAFDTGRFLQWEMVEGVGVPVDHRASVATSTIAPTTSEPYILMAIELGLDTDMALLAAQVFAAQSARYEATGIATALSEDHLDRAPYFLYGSVWNDRSAWAVVDDKGKSHEDLRAFSTKAAFGWNAIYDMDYSDVLRDQVDGLSAEGHGWYAGRYEATMEVNATLTANTNGVILEALSYKAQGQLLPPR
jgi:Protein of unknown function (DUF3131)